MLTYECKIHIAMYLINILNGYITIASYHLNVVTINHERKPTHMLKHLNGMMRNVEQSVARFIDMIDFNHTRAIIV